MKFGSMKLGTKFLIISLIAVFPLVVVASEYFRTLETQEAAIREFHEQDMKEMTALSDLFARTTDNHAQIFSLLSTAGKAHDEEEIYDKARVLVDKIYRISEEVERYHAGLGEQLGNPALAEDERVFAERRYNISRTLISGLENYRANVIQAVEMVTLDLNLFGRYAIQANEIVRDVQKGFLSLTTEIHRDIAADVAELGEENQWRLWRFQIIIVFAGLVSVAMVLVTATVSKGLSGDLRKIIAVISGVARGDVVKEVPFLERPNEVGEIARATRAFVDTLIELRRTNEEKSTEIAERRRAEKALRESERRFRTVVDNLPSFFSLKDKDGRYILGNQEHYAVFGIKAEDLAGRDAEQVLSPEVRDAVLAHDRAVIESKTAITQEREIPVNGEKRTFLVTKFPLTDSSGAVTGLGSLGTDVTDLKQTEAQLVQAAKLATLGQMASGIAHELNQPLNIIRMAAESSLMGIEEGVLDEATSKKKLRRIENQAERMAKIIDHMRIFTREDQGEGDGVFSPATGVENCLSMMAQQLSAAGIALEREISDGGGLVRGTMVKLEQVVMNLLTNARQAVTVHREAETAAGNGFEGRIGVAVNDNAADGTVTISVCDNGGGIPPDVRAHIFDPFYTTKEEGEGTGLGLSVSYRIIEGMGGRLEAVDVDGGTRFDISLPRAADAEPTAEKPADAEPAAATPATKAAAKKGAERRLCRVLVVDDEEMAAEALAEYLERKGYDVAVANDGSRALESFGGQEADVVITDLRMPVMDGYELIERLREAHPDLPIMVTTGHTTVGDEDEFYPEGATYVLKKPISLREIMDHLNQLAADDPAA